jgi:hypothetical protein
MPMQVAASFLEYLVSGVVALIWLAPLLQRDLMVIGSLSTPEAVVLLPILYVVGILIDGLGYLATRPLKRRLRARRGSHSHELDGESATTFVIHHSTELGKAMEVRSTRDRIARGMIINFFAAGVVVIVRNWRDGVAPSGFSVGLFACAALSGVLWWRFQELSSDFKHNAVDTILRAQGRKKQAHNFQAAPPNTAAPADQKAPLSGR